MRLAAIVQSLSLAVVAAALLVACGGGGAALVPAADVPTVSKSTPAALPSEASVGPTPVVPASPISVPTPVATSSATTGLPTAAPDSVAIQHHHRHA